MCLAIFKPKNQPFPCESIIARAWTNNDDGAGIAIRLDNEVKIIKGLMTLDELMFTLSNDLIKHDVVIHLRYATSGNVSESMCHPFPVSNDNNDLKSLELLTGTAIVHNGVMFSPRFNSGYSDTAIFARFLAIKGIDYKAINQIIGNDRLAIITKDDVELIGDWTEIDGIFYSNTYSIIEPKKSTYSFLDDPFYFRENDWAHYDSRHFLDDSDDDLDYCPHCLSDEIEHIGINSLTFECLSCGTIFNETHVLEPFELSDKPKKNKNKKLQRIG